MVRSILYQHIISYQTNKRLKCELCVCAFVCGARGYETAKVRDVRKIGGGHGLRGESGKEWIGHFLDDLRGFGINADQWTTAAQDEGG